MPDKNKLVELTDAVEYSEPPSSLSKDIADVESNGGNYSAYNTSGKHPTYALGKYQFVPSYHWDDIQKVTGVKTHQEFLHDPQAQEDYYKWHVEHHLKPGIERMREFNKAGYNENQLASLVHFKGEGGAKDWLTNGVDKTKENNVSIPDYIGEPEGNDLKELVDAEEIPDDLSQKKSPDVSADGVADNSQPGQSGVSQNEAPIEGLTPTDPLTHLPIIGNNQPQQNDNQPQQNDNQPQQTASSPNDIPRANGAVTGGFNPQSAADWKPENLSKTQQQPISPKDKTDAATKYLAEDVVNNAYKFPAYADNLNKVPINQPGGVAHDITDPHGDPKMTGGYTQTRLADLSHQWKIDRESAKSAMQNDPNPAAVESLGKVDAKYYADKKALEDNAGHILDLQLVNKYATTKKYTEAESKTALDLLNQKKDEEIVAIPFKKDYRGGIPYRQKLDEINEKYVPQEAQIRDNTKWDALTIGMQKQKFLGNPHAVDDEKKWRNGIPLSPDRKAAYETAGYSAMQTAAKSAAANGQTAIAQEINDHSSDANERLLADNKDYFKDVVVNDIGNHIYKTENPIYGTLFSKFEISPEELKDAATATGHTLEELKKLGITSADIPKSASLVAQAGQSAINALTNSEGDALTGKMPQPQTDFRNVRGFLGHVAGGAGMVAGFLGEAKVASNILKGAGVLGDAVKNASRYDILANQVTLTAANYNSAYNESKTLIGDKPKDELKRQTYAMINAVVGTAIMEATGGNPITLGQKALGETKAGQDILQAIKSGKIQDLTKDEFQTGIQKALESSKIFAQETGKMAGTMGAVEIAKNITNKIYDPQGHHDITDNVQNAAISGGISMLLPSALAGINHPAQQTQLNKSLMWDVGNNSRKYREEVTKLYQQGKMSKDEFATSLDGINKMGHIINAELPRENKINGKELLPEQKVAYAWNLLQNKDLNTKLEQLTGAPNPDESQVKLVKEALNKLGAERTDILNKAGEVEKQTLQPKHEPSGVSGKPQGPLKLDKSTEELQPTGAIATEPAIVPEGETQKINEEKIGNTENTSIPLESEIKPSENEISNQAPSGEERQDNILQPQDQNNEVRQEANSAGRNEPQEDRQLSEKTSEENKAGVETPAKPVLTESGKKLTPKEKAQLAKAKKVPVTETEEPLPSGPQKPASDASPQTESTPAGSDQRKNNEPVATKEKLNPSTQPTGAIATEAKSEEQSSATKEIENKISLKQAEIDHQKKILAAAHNTISKSLKSGDIEAHNKALAEAKQAEELIRKKEKSLKSLQEEQKIKSGYNQTADALEGHFDKLRKRKEESSLAGLGLPDHVTKWLEDKVVELLRQTGNLHVALHRGIELMKAKFGELVEHITTSDAEELRASLPFAEKPQEKEPIFTGTKTNAEANREYAQGYIDGIRDKSISHEDAEYEILDDEDLSPEEKGKILNYIDWDLNNEIPDKDNKVASYDLKDSGLSNFLGTETTKDVVGEDHLFDNPDEKKNAVRLTDLLDDAKNITQSYQNEGGPASKWGKRMYEDILKVNNDPKKQGAFIAGLHIELQSAHFENQKNINELDEALKAEKSPDKIQELQDRRLELIKENAKLERVIGDVQNFGKKLASTASDVMNTRRLDRMLRDDILKDYYHDKILNEQEIRRQRETEAALNQSIIEDYKNHPQYKKDMDEAKRSAERKKKEGKKSSVIEKAKEKTKNAVNRLTGRSKDTIEKAKVKKEKAKSEFPRDEKGNIMTPEQFIEYIKKLKNPC